MEVEVEGQRSAFDVSGLEHKKANEKRELIYVFREQRKEGALVFSAAFLFTDDRANVGEAYRRYWFDNMDTVLTSLTAGR